MADLERCPRCNAELPPGASGDRSCSRCLLLLGIEGSGGEAGSLGGGLAGGRLGAYRILGLLGEGGMGQVWAARDPRLDRTVALKVLPPEMAADPARLARFRREARTIASLDHPGIVTIHSIEEADGLHFLTMERVEGESLARLIPPGGMPAERWLTLALALAEALQAAHDRGVVHRDLKPSNVVVDGSGRPRLLDFGLARSAAPLAAGDPDAGLSLTHSGTVLGTLPYMAPEQLRGRRVDARVDQFSLGVVMYEMATGERPFAGSTAAELIAAILKDPPARLSARCPALAGGVETMVARCLEKEPERRFPDVAAVAAALSGFTAALDPPSARWSGASGHAAAATFASGSSWYSGVSGADLEPTGRAVELGRLDRFLDEALAGSRRIVFVTGDSGMGKTTLVSSFAQRARRQGGPWLGHGQCLEQGGPTEAYMPVLEALGRMARGDEAAALVDLLRRRAPTWLAQMPALVADGERENLERRVLGATRERMLREMAETLEALTAERPVLLVLEDLQWSDPSTLDLLSAVARRPEPARLLVVLTFRPHDLSERRHPLHRLLGDCGGSSGGPCREVALQPLPEPAVEAYLADRFPAARLPDGLAGLLHRRTGGHPLFVATVVDAWITRGLAVEGDGGWTVADDTQRLCGEVPETLRQLIGRQLEALDAEHRDLLEAAAVAGVGFSAALPAAALECSVEDAEERCAALARHGRWLTSRGSEEWPDGTLAARFAFGHHLVHEVLYSAIPAARRARLHRQIGERLERGWETRPKSRAVELAFQFSRGRDARRAVRHLQLAAEHALGRSAHREAVDLLRQALDLLPRLPDDEERQRAEVAVQALQAPSLIALEGWSSDAAEAAYLRALELAEALGDDGRRSKVLYGLATMRELRGQYRATEALLQQRLSLAVDDPEDAESLETRELLACSTFHQGHFTHALDHARRGLRLFAPDRHRALLAQENLGVSCHDWAALSLWFLGRPDRAVAEAVAAVELARRLDHPYSRAHAHHQAATVRQLRGEVEACHEEAETTLALARQHEFPYRVATADVLLGWVAAITGDAESGLGRLRDGIDTCRAMGAVLDLPYFQCLLAEALQRARRSDEAIAVVAAALAEPASAGCFVEAELHRLRGRLHLEATDAGAARACFERALEVAGRQGARSLELRAAIELARLPADPGGESRAARRRLEILYRGFEEGLDTADLLRARDLVRAEPAA